ncbi:MAG: hypothetical protein ACKPJD_23360, partial [Planctomycetaceae bacterium]
VAASLPPLTTLSPRAFHFAPSREPPPLRQPRNVSSGQHSPASSVLTPVGSRSRLASMATDN